MGRDACLGKAHWHAVARPRGGMLMPTHAEHDAGGTATCFVFHRMLVRRTTPIRLVQTCSTTVY